MSELESPIILPKIDSLANNVQNDNNDSQFFSQAIPKQASTDEQIINLWLYSKSQTTQEAYSRDVKEFQNLIQKPLKQVILQDLHTYGQYLATKGLQPRSQQRKLACIKSLFSFATKLGYLQFDVGKVVKLPKYKDNLASRILDQSSITKIIYNEKNLRNRLFLKLSYLIGARVSEMINLKWEDFNPNADSVIVTLFGKGGKTRNVLITNHLYDELKELKIHPHPTDYVFISRKTKSKLGRQQAFTIVKNAANKAGIDKKVSPHWFRHAHASHALAKGAPMPLIQRDLGHSSLAITGKYLHVKPTDGSGLWLDV